MFRMILTVAATIFPSVVYRLVLKMKTDSVLSKHEVKESAISWNEAAGDGMKWANSGHQQLHVQRYCTIRFVYQSLSSPGLACMNECIFWERVIPQNQTVRIVTQFKVSFF
jgi:hypothetical protein